MFVRIHTLSPSHPGCATGWVLIRMAAVTASKSLIQNRNSGWLLKAENRLMSLVRDSLIRRTHRLNGVDG